MRSHLWWALTPLTQRRIHDSLAFPVIPDDPKYNHTISYRYFIHVTNSFWVAALNIFLWMMNFYTIFFPKYDIEGKILTFASENSSLKKKRKNEYPSKFCMGIALPLGSKVARKMSFGVILLNIHLTNILRLVSWSTFLIYISFKN